MTEEAFIEKLDKKRYSYRIKGGKIIVTHKGHVHLSSLTSLPPDVVFRNREYVDLRSLISLPPGVEFKNEGGVYLRDLTGDWFSNWQGNIKGIDSNSLLNLMISKGIFI